MNGNWRAAHAWLRGLSDARAGKPALERDKFPFQGEDTWAAYERGYGAAS